MDCVQAEVQTGALNASHGTDIHYGKEGILKRNWTAQT